MSRPHRTLTALFVLLLPLLSGCATHLDGARYSAHDPAFDLFTFFDGEVTAWGLVQDRSGEVTQRFVVDITGTVDGDRLQLDERFNYRLGDGVRHRIWDIERLPDGSYRGRADDILDVARGEAWGNAFRWTYAMDLPVDDTTYRVTFEDWIWAMDENTIVNRSYIQKFGLDVAEVTIFMRRQTP
jgi:hypothetical protein